MPEAAGLQSAGHPHDHPDQCVWSGQRESNSSVQGGSLRYPQNFLTRTHTISYVLLVKEQRNPLHVAVFLLPVQAEET